MGPNKQLLLAYPIMRPVEVVERIERGRDVVEFVIEKIGVGMGGPARRAGWRRQGLRRLG
jgi:hypothetical protein